MQRKPTTNYQNYLNHSRKFKQFPDNRAYCTVAILYEIEIHAFFFSSIGHTSSMLD